jgi:hypothetical protein
VAGFAPRKIEVEPLKRERGAGDEAVHTFTLRCRVEASNEFVAFCIAEKLTYREGMDVVAQMLRERQAKPKLSSVSLP